MLSDAAGGTIGAVAPGSESRLTTSSTSPASRRSARRGLAEPDDEHDGRLHRQLDVDVVGAAQRVGDLVARAARAAHVEHDPQRVVAGHPHAADQRGVDERDAGDRLELRARDLDRLERLVQELLAVQRELAARAVERRDQQRRRARRAQQPQRARHRAGVDAAAVADVQHRALGQRAGDLVRAREHRVGALRQRGRRQRLVEAEVRAPRLVDDERHAGAVRDLGAAGDVGGHAVVGRRDDERGPRVGRRGSAASSAAGVTQWVIPSSSSYSGATKLGIPPLSTSPSTIDACELRWATIRAPSGASARQSVWLPCVAPLVRKNVRAAPNASAASSSARS